MKDKAKRDRLAELAAVPATLIFFESPHRIAATVTAAAEVLGADRRAAVCRELTKTFEEFRRGTLGELAAIYDESANVRGEIVLVVGPPEAKPQPEAADVDALLKELARDLPMGKAATEAARRTGWRARSFTTGSFISRMAMKAERPDTRKLKALKRGHIAEYRAALCLMLKGYRIVAMRYRTRLGEIDIIARRGDLVACVEVKAR